MLGGATVPDRHRASIKLTVDTYTHLIPGANRDATKVLQDSQVLFPPMLPFQDKNLAEFHRQNHAYSGLIPWR